MKGQVLDYSIQNNAGVISADNGQRYSFTGGGWQASNPPSVGMHVDFQPNGNTAIGIYAVPGANSTAGSASSAASGTSAKISTMGIVGMSVGLLAIIFLKSTLLGFLLMVVGLGSSVAGLIIGKRRGEQVGFAVAGIVLSLIPLVLNIIIATAVTLMLNADSGNSGGILKAIVKQVLPFY